MKESCDVFHEDLPRNYSELVPMTPEEGLQMLRRTFYGAVSKSRAPLEAELTDKEPLEDVQKLFHQAQLVEIILEGGTGPARNYCQANKFTETDSEELISGAKEFIINTSQEYANFAREIAIGRYNQLYSKLVEMHDYKGCAIVQRCLDRLQGIDAADSMQNDFSRGLMSVMMQVAKEDPNPLKQPLKLGADGSLGPVSNGPKTIIETTPGDNIRIEHDV